MSRYKFEAGGDEFDTPDTFEPIKTSRMARSGKEPGWNTRGTGPKPRPRRPEGKVHAVRRALVTGQHQVLATAITEALGGRRLSVSGVDRTRPYVTVLPLAQSQAIFRDYFARGKDKERAAALDGYNQSVRGYLNQANNEHPTIAAELGELDTFGAGASGGTGRSFIGIRLAGEGGNTLIRQNRDLIRTLNAADACAWAIRPSLYSDDPCLSLAETYSQPIAEALVDELNQAGLVETVRQQLGSADNPQQLANFGRAIAVPGGR